VSVSLTVTGSNGPVHAA